MVSVLMRGRRGGLSGRVERREKACWGWDMWISRYRNGVIKAFQEELTRRSSEIRDVWEVLYGRGRELKEEAAEEGFGGISGPTYPAVLGHRGHIQVSVELLPHQWSARTHGNRSLEK
jgi:hypothetical protein